MQEKRKEQSEGGKCPNCKRLYWKVLRKDSQGGVSSVSTLIGPSPSLAWRSVISAVNFSAERSSIKVSSVGLLSSAENKRDIASRFLPMSAASVSWLICCCLRMLSSACRSSS